MRCTITLKVYKTLPNLTMTNKYSMLNYGIYLVSATRKSDTASL